MDSGSAVVVAAIISGAVVTSTFLAAEILRTRRGIRELRVEAVVNVITELDKIPIHASRVGKPWRRQLPLPDFAVGSAAIMLVAFLPRRDRPVVRWIGWRLNQMPEADPMERLELAADVESVLIEYLSSRRRAHAYVRKYRSDVEGWYASRDQDRWA